MHVRKNLRLGIVLAITICSITGCAWFDKQKKPSDEVTEPSWDLFEMSDDRAAKAHDDKRDPAFDFGRGGTQGSGVTAQGRDIERRLGYR